MKKSVVVLIGIIYLASIALVSFFGLQFKLFEEVVPVESIEIINDDVKVNAQGQQYVIVTPDANGDRTYQIKWRVHPDNASNTAVSFSYDHQNTAVTVDPATGLVTFSKMGYVSVTIVALDGTDASTTLLLYAY